MAHVRTYVRILFYSHTYVFIAFDYNAPETLDQNGWSALHHAADAVSYSLRAFRAAHALLLMTPADIINHQTTGHTPTELAHDRIVGYTVLHFLCDGSDKQCKASALVKLAIDQQADLDKVNAAGNTPLFLACATGVTDTVNVLISRGANMNPHKCTDRRKPGIMQRARRSSQNVVHELNYWGAESDHNDVTMNPQHNNKKSMSKLIRHGQNFENKWKRKWNRWNRWNQSRQWHQKTWTHEHCWQDRDSTQWWQLSNWRDGGWRSASEY